MDFEYLKEDISKVYSIDSKLYEQLDVKRGVKKFRWKWCFSWFK